LPPLRFSFSAAGCIGGGREALDGLVSEGRAGRDEKAAKKADKLGIAYGNLPTGDRGENLRHTLPFEHACPGQHFI
jgi:hypothetical protein